MIHRRRSRYISIMQDEIGQQFRTDRELVVIVIDQSQRSEFVHEVRDAGPRGAHDFSQGQHPYVRWCLPLFLLLPSQVFYCCPIDPIRS